MSILVTTPTGNIGRVVVEKLLEAGAEVSVIARKPEKLAPAVRERVTVHQGDQEDAAFVAEATKGAEALFWLTPPNFLHPDWKSMYEHSAQTAANAVRANRIPHVVHLSSSGADRATGFGPVSFLQIVENALAATGASVLQLRPGYFYENWLTQLEPMLHQGATYFPFSPDTTHPQIATKDIGSVAARKLLDRSWSGVSVLGLHGPADQTSFGEAATILGEVIGRPVQFVQIPMEAFQQQLSGMGAPPSVVESYSELFGAFARGEPLGEPRTAETTTPTTLREWATETLLPLAKAARQG
ncbi:MAG: NAD(P)H-binding protein [Cytophagales bacterium]|nr:NAD(P)H-binding protein [Armatimonadota bacterium]